MVCPVCKEEMIILELNDIEIDFCLACKGVWLDEGELENLLGTKKEIDELYRVLSEEEVKSEKRLKCPACNKKMRKFVFRNDKNKIVVDECSNKHGIWFDKGELYNLVDEHGDNNKTKVLNALSGFFRS